MSMLEPQVDNSPVFIDGELRVERAHEESRKLSVRYPSDTGTH